MMKKFMIALGIAFAFICGVLIGTNINANTEVEEVEVTNRIEELACDYIAKDHPDRSIEDVELKRIEEDDLYAGEYRADFVYQFDGGSVGYCSIGTGILD